jgi:hypothetical protein
MISVGYLPLGASYRQRLTEAACYLPVSELSNRSIEEYETGFLNWSPSTGQLTSNSAANAECNRVG